MTLGASVSSLGVYLGARWRELRGRHDPPNFAASTLRAFFIHALGFSNRKQQLLFDFRPPRPQAICMETTMRWITETLVEGKTPRGALRTG